MKIGIIGSGNVGGTLGARWAAGGHTVVFSSRKPESEEMKALVARAGTNARAATLGETVAASDVLLLATPWPATKETLLRAGTMAGKVLIDATNPLAANLTGLELGTTTSGGEQVAQWAPGAHVVKAFNSIGNNVMADPKFGERWAAMLYCGDDAAAKKTVQELAVELGFNAVDAGPLAQARALEPMALLWISMALVQGYGREIAFDFMRR